jgi:spermidine synthase
MNPKNGLILIAFGFSGALGLAYEILWARYVGLMLGHASYAQAIVVTIFMAGLAIGAALAGFYLSRIHRPLFSYGIIELALGVMAILFPFLFAWQAAREASFWSNSLWAVALLLPQTILLGATLPLICAFFTRNCGNADELSRLYFLNSLGAAFGAILSGFILLPQLGLEKSLYFLGSFNLLLAVFVLIHKEHSGAKPDSTINKKYSKYFIFAILSGFCAFVYEIIWVRMLSLLIGSATHSFEIVLSAYILGLAIGAFWSHRTTARLVTVGRLFLLMALFAVLSLLTFSLSFDIVAWLVHNAPKNDVGYLAYQASSYLLAMLIMFPATFCAGAALPLLARTTYSTLPNDSSIGLLYSLNTIGAIFGALGALFWGLPALGLKGSLVTAAAVNIILAFCILRPAPKKLFLNIIVFTLLALVPLNSRKMASGVFRDGHLLSPENSHIVFEQHGSTATVHLVQHESGGLGIHTNGKPDALMFVDNKNDFFGDEPAMAMAGALPLLLRPNSKTAVNIGFGSGYTANTLLASPRIEKLYNIEIEPAILAAAQGYRPNLESPHSDPRSRILIEDAKIFLKSKAQYDIIVSEPSNPWISGVAGLFSKEFFGLVADRLASDGIFVQWIQLYETNLDIVASIMKSLSEKFSDYAIYAPHDSDIMIVATKQGKLPSPSWDQVKGTRMEQELARIRVHSIADVQLRYLAGRRTLAPYYEWHPTPAHSDFVPTLEYLATKARFNNENASGLLELQRNSLPITEMLEGRRITVSSLTPNPYSQIGRELSEATKLKAKFWSNLDCSKTAWNFPQFLNNLRKIQLFWPEHIAKAESLIGQKCISSQERSLLKMELAISKRDQNSMERFAIEVLHSGPNTEQQRALSTLLLALISGGKQEAAQAALLRWQNISEPSNFLFDLLRSQIHLKN